MRLLVIALFALWLMFQLSEACKCCCKYDHGCGCGCGHGYGHGHGHGYGGYGGYPGCGCGGIGCAVCAPIPQIAPVAQCTSAVAAAPIIHHHIMKEAQSCSPATQSIVGIPIIGNLGLKSLGKPCGCRGYCSCGSWD